MGIRQEKTVTGIPLGEDHDGDSPENRVGDSPG